MGFLIEFGEVNLDKLGVRRISECVSQLFLIFKNYVLLWFIGCGNMLDVCLVMGLDGCEVVIKLLFFVILCQYDVVECFGNEVWLILQFWYLYVVCGFVGMFFGLGVFLVFFYYFDGLLSNCLCGQLLLNEEVLWILVDIVVVFVYLYWFGVVYQDVKL